MFRTSSHHVPDAGDDALPLHSTFAPHQLDCFPSQSELQIEVIATLLFLVLGFTLAFAAKRIFCKACAHTGRPLPEGLAGLRCEMIAEVARFLPLQDLAAVSATNHAEWHRFGLSPAVWYLRAADKKLDLGGGSDWSMDSKLSKGNECGQAFREAFRRSHLHIDKPLVDVFSEDAWCGPPGIGGMGHTAILAEASRIFRGVMPRDGDDIVELTCLAAERALQAHNPSSKDATRCAMDLLDIVRRRQDIVNEDHVERLQSAYTSSLQLQALMDSSMDSDIDIEGTLAEQLEDMHERTRHCELDMLLEELTGQIYE